MAEVKDPISQITDKRFTEPLAVLRSGREKEAQKAQELVTAEGKVETEKQRVAELESGLQTAAAEEEAEAVRRAKEDYQGKLEREPLPAFVPTQDNVQSIAALFSLIGVMGMIAGKGESQRALGAMNGMLEGHRKGRADLYKQEKATFEKNFNAMLKKHEEFRKEMEDAVKTAAVDRDLGYQKARNAAVRAGSEVVKANIEKFGVAKTYENLVAYNKSVEEAYKMYREEKRHEQTLAQQKALAQMKIGLKNLGKELPLVQGIRGIEHLQTQLQDPEVQKGLLAKTAPLLEKIASLSGSEDFESAVNRTLTGTDKTTLFLKDALLETYNIERAAKGGQRLTVQDMKTIGPVLDPTNYTPQAYNALLDNRRKILYENLQDIGYTVPQIKEATTPRAYTPFAGEASTTVTKPMPTGEKMKAYADKYYGGDENAAKEHLKSQGYK